MNKKTASFLISSSPHVKTKINKKEKKVKKSCLEPTKFLIQARKGEFGLGKFIALLFLLQKKKVFEVIAIQEARWAFACGNGGTKDGEQKIKR